VDRVVWSEEVFLLAGKNIACMLSWNELSTGSSNNSLNIH
jgi:hypothetical protein